MTFLAVLIGALFVAAPAEAGPIVAAIAVGIKTLAAWQIGSFAIGSFILRTAASFALSALARARQEKPRAAGLRTDSTLAGEATSGSVVIGRYATAGVMACPPMTDRKWGKTPNAILTYVVELGDAPFTSLDGIWIGDEKVQFLAPSPDSPFPDHNRCGGKYLGKVWFKFFDGRQSAAYPGLLETDGNGRPWEPDMVGRGIPFVVIRFRYDRETFQGLPSCLFEVTGIGLYDPRKDSSIGGVGEHRWGDLSTYEPSENTAVQIYNILRGIELPDGSVWGGSADAEDLPLGSWFAEMNKADALIGDEPRFRSSYEIKIGPESLGGDEPAEVIETLLRGSDGAISEFGGVWKIRLGGPGLPVAFFTDDDVIVTEAQNRTPFPGLQETCNGVTAQYPAPLARWANKEAPPRFDADLEALDGGNRLVAALMLPATPYPKQVQRVQRALLKDERRFLSHELVLPPDFTLVEVLDCVSWASEENGYLGKTFSVNARQDQPLTLLQHFGLREVDPSDRDWSPDFELPDTVRSPTTDVPAPRAIADFNAEASSVPGPGGSARLPSILLTWPTDEIAARGIRFVITEKASGRLASSGSIHELDEGALNVSQGILPNTRYLVRGRLVSDLATIWSADIEVLTLDIRLGSQDVDFEIIKAEVREDLADLEEWAGGTGEFIRGLREEIAAIRDGVAEIDFSTYERHEAVRRETAVEIGKARGEFFEQIDIAASETEAVAQRLTGLTATVAGNTAAITTEQTARASADEAIASSVEVVSTKTAENTAAIASEKLARTNAVAAIALTVDAVEAKSNANAAAITQERLARTDAFEALAADITTVESALGNKANASAVSALTTRVTDNEGEITATADKVDLVEARTNRSSASGRFRVQAISTPSGAHSRIVLKAEAETNTDEQSAALFLEARTDGGNQVYVVADRFAVVQGANGVRRVPFVVDAGVVYMDEAFIRQAAIKTAHLDNAVINRAKIIDLEVVTGKLADGSVTKFFEAANYGGVETDNTSTSVRITNFVWTATSDELYTFKVRYRHKATDGGAAAGRIEINRDGETQWQSFIEKDSTSSTDGPWKTYILGGLEWLGAGSHNIDVRLLSSGYHIKMAAEIVLTRWVK